LLKKYSSVVQRALSSSSTRSNQKLFTIQKEKDKFSKKTNIFAGSASSLNSTSNESQFSDHYAVNSNTNNTSTNNSNNKVALNVHPKLSFRNNIQNKTLSEELAEELEVTKDILIKYNVPIDRKIIKVLREYICQYGSVQAFKTALESENEKNKLNAFVASSCAAIYNTAYPNLVHSKYF
jgi:hypothetical protein